jgi:hypothetical protein
VRSEPRAGATARLQNVSTTGVDLSRLGRIGEHEASTNNPNRIKRLAPKLSAITNLEKHALESSIPVARSIP